MLHYPAIVLEEIAEESDSDQLLARFLGPLAREDDDSPAEPEGAQQILDWVAKAPASRATRLAHVVRYAVKDGQTDALRWSQVALNLIAIAPDPGPVLKAFEHRFPTGAGWGPLVLRFVRRRPLVAAMAGHDDPRIRAWSRTAGRSLEDSIKHWDQWDRDQDSRFED
jgi:hypothetical protein